jgi:hypothetical protein
MEKGKSLELHPDDTELLFIQRAARHLEKPSFLIAAAAKLGQPIEALTKALPNKARDSVTWASHKALSAALSAAVKTIHPSAGTVAKGGNLSVAQLESLAMERGRIHTAVVTTSGGIGGFLGGWALGAELPFSTTVMLRAIAETAVLFGEDLSQQDTRFECLGVFSFGSPSRSDDAADSAYYAARVSLAAIMRDLAKSFVGKSAADIGALLSAGGSPLVAQLIGQIASRFNIVVSQKAVAQALPIVGAVGGAGLNLVFAEHFTKVAVMHFGIRSLERKYGAGRIKKIYDEARRVVDVPG